ncbi:MAG TPA: tRNA threonylcarbamoyladenosine dehydratase [Candidatus Ozemobacteraceae bacterium]|nr:tRNA threonylcarbamoyladenosine dehydratase [Candidatus Ozemobacteraceae bacterium]
MGGDETRFYRTELLIGPDALKKLEGAHVAVFGMGGVGSYAVEGLARAGVGHLTLVDFDTIGRTNLNRQIMALESTIGRPKVDAMGDRVLDINPACVVERHQVFFDREQIAGLLQRPYSLVIDAIDSFNPKITLMVETVKAGLPLLSAMGAAAKIDPTRVKACDISETTICPFARRIRKRLRSFGIERGITVISSVEPPIMPYHPDEIPGERREVTLTRGRPRMIQGSIGYMTAIFGMMLAGVAVQRLTGLATASQTPRGFTAKATASLPAVKDDENED